MYCDISDIIYYNQRLQNWILSDFLLLSICGYLTPIAFGHLISKYEPSLIFKTNGFNQ